MFRSATIRLTGWYLAILMSISILFSAIIYQINYAEIETRLQNLQNSVVEIIPGVFYRGAAPQDLNIRRTAQISEAGYRLFWSLFWINIGVLIFGGLLSYYFARRTLEPIEEAHEAQSRFTSDASHELRTPLSSMKTELEDALSNPNLTKAESKELLKSSLEEVDKLIGLSETLLKLSRMEHEALQTENFNLLDVAQSAVEGARKRRDNITIQSPKSASVHAHKSSIEDATNILLDNAIKHSEEGSPLILKISKHRLHVQLAVQNEGQIPPEQQKLIFNRFYRASTSRTSGKTHGYGLGLSIAQKIAEANNSSIKVSSSKGKTTFSIIIPKNK